MTAKKRGRPTDNVKDKRITIRLDDETSSILENYAKKEGKTKADAIRDGIKKLKGN